MISIFKQFDFKYLPLALILIIATLLYRYLKSRYRYWEIRGIPHLKPNLLFGNATDLVLGRKSILEYQKHLYKQVKPNRLLGIFMFQKPTLYITDLEWIKGILVRDASHFYDRGLNFDTKTEPLTKHLFHLEGEEWKVMRNKVMPGFTLNGILVWLPILLESAINLQYHLSNVSDMETDLDLKNIMSRYAAEVIGKCAFGLKKGPLTGDNEKFYKMSKQIFSPRMRTIIKLILPKLPNFLTELFDIKMIETEVSNFFTNVVKKEMQFRSQSNVRPNDFLEFMIELRNKDQQSCSDIIPVTDELVMSHCFMLFIAGYENTTAVLCAALFELARNPDIQEKLHSEICNCCFYDGDTEITLKKLSEMTYLDMVFNEVVRLYPPASGLIRECTKEFTLPGTNLALEKGLQIVIPVVAINSDPCYYDYPNEFNPENFSEKAKQARSRYAFTPFGEGPRACIGKKFATVQIKIGLIMLVYNYEFFPSPKMKLPVTFEKQSFVTSIEGGAWVRCRSRNNL